jgi:hypothetical protein
MGLDELIGEAKVEKLKQPEANTDYNDPLYRVIKDNMKAKATTEVMFPEFTTIAS